MNPIYQTSLDGKNGNCIQAVLASLLHLPIEDIPVFPNPDTWIVDLNRWLRQFHMAYLPMTDFRGWRESLGIKACFHEVADPFPGAEGLDHIHSCGIFIALQPWRMVEMRAQIHSLAAAIEGMVGATSITELQEMLQALKPLAKDNIDAAAGVVAIQALINLRKGEEPPRLPVDHAYDGDRP